MTDQKRERKFKLAAFREHAIESRSQLAGITLEAEDGSEHYIPHPLAVDDETQERIEAFQRGDGLDRDENGRIKEPHQIKKKPADSPTIRSAKAILGDEKHKAFIAAGGHSNDVTLAWQMMVEEHKERESSDPKLSIV